MTQSGRRCPYSFSLLILFLSHSVCCGWRRTRGERQGEYSPCCLEYRSFFLSLSSCFIGYISQNSCCFSSCEQQESKSKLILQYLSKENFPKCLHSENDWDWISEQDWPLHLCGTSVQNSCSKCFWRHAWVHDGWPESTRRSIWNGWLELRTLETIKFARLS